MESGSVLCVAPARKKKVKAKRGRVASVANKMGEQVPGFYFKGFKNYRSCLRPVKQFSLNILGNTFACCSLIST